MANPWDAAQQRRDGSGLGGLTELCGELGIERPAAGMEAQDMTRSCLQLLLDVQRAAGRRQALDRRVKELEHATAVDDLVCEDRVGHRVALLEQLDSHIESTLQQRQVLAARLQRSFADSCVPVEYECQRDFVDLAHAIPDFIRSYATAQGALQWLAEFDVHARPMRDVAESAPRVQARLHRYLVQLQQLRSTLNGLAAPHVAAASSAQDSSNE